MFETKSKSYLRLVALITLFAISLTSFIIFSSNVISVKANEEDVYLGGFPVGINLQSKGLIVEDFKVIITDNGNFYPAKDAGLMIGDMIIEANNNPICTPQELENALGKTPSNINLKVIRNNAELNIICQSIFDPFVGSPKLGLIVKNEINGVGTVTYYDKKGKFCALGHKICDSSIDNSSLFQNGSLYSANIIGVYKGHDGEAGALKGVFNKSGDNIGIINKNCNFGIYGKLNNDFKTNTITIKKGQKSNISLGKAYIYSSIEGNSPDKYEIEIVKTIPQNDKDIKSMVIRVTDKKLIDATGGIVQGMSGSPIIQNDRLIGAITHVFLNDAKIGYGVYIDWLGWQKSSIKYKFCRIIYYADKTCYISQRLF